ncbi:MAG TPA: EamA family transporter [Candidatus Aphodousia gallistercoris]|mgnify:CR=1 FL=1|nr:EamA family transporter [Candidatus Aphodousia gallistercoris]
MLKMQGDAKLWRGFFCTLIGGIGWGFSGACGQYLFLYQEVDPMWLTVVRMLSAGLILSILFVLPHARAMRPMLRPGTQWLWLVIYALGGLMISQFGYLSAVKYTNSGTATMLVYLNPVFILLCVCVLAKRFPLKKELIAIVFALMGTFFMATHGNLSHLVISSQGLFWGIASAVGIAVYTILPAQCLSKYSTQALMAIGMFVGGFIMAFAVDFVHIPYRLDYHGYLAMALIILLGTVAAFLLYMQGVADLGSVKASMIACVEPISAAVFSLLWFDAHFVLMDYLGFACILATIFVLGRR